MTDVPHTVPAALDRLVEQLPQHPVLIAEGRSFTASDLRSEVHNAAAALIALGVNAGDRVAGSSSVGTTHTFPPLFVHIPHTRRGTEGP